MRPKSLRRTRSSAARIAETIHTARYLFKSQFPSEDFDAVVWSLESLNYRPGVQDVKFLRFTRLKRPDEPLPELYASLIKSWIVLEEFGSGERYSKLRAARYLWEELLSRREGKPEQFQWETLTLDDICQAELAIIASVSESVAYHATIYLKKLVKFLEDRQVCRPLHFTMQCKRPESAKNTISLERAGKIRKLPSQQALEGLAAVFHERAQEPADRLRMAALAVLVVTGFRISELLTLPLDCEEVEVHRGKQHYGLRYYPAKSRKGALKLAVRWLTPIGEQLARKAIAEIRSITAPFREQACRLEQNPSRTVFPDNRGEEKLTSKQVWQMLGMKRYDSINRIPKQLLPRYGTALHYYYLASEVEAYLRTLQPSLWTLDRRDGTYQWLSETLFIAPRWFFRPYNGVNTSIIEPVTSKLIAKFLTSPTSSVFKRFDIRETDGTICRMATHQFRHWLNDLADKGGLPLDLQTRWFGRENKQDTYAYHHATIEERVQWVKQGIREGTIGGFLSDVYFALPEEDRDIFLEGQVQAVHVTAFGLCLHDYSLDPCPYHLNCLRGCREYLRTKGNQQERTYLIQIYKRTEHGLQMAQEAASAGKGVHAEAWIRHHEETLAGCKAALAIDEQNPEALAGALIHPFDGQQSKFHPF
ncbi:MAG TPA: hypothetical protein VKT82_00145 [Ktedonobacterales bacterium]|nr:hypothetical protein [Ktedonobacterales bacterium]